MRCAVSTRVARRSGSFAKFTTVMLALTAASPLASAQSTTTITGRIVSLNRTPVANIRLRVVGLGNPTMFQSGEFSIEIPTGAQDVVFESQSAGWEIVYPFGGRLARGSETVILVVGRPVEQTITEALAERSRQLEQVLREHGQQGQTLGRVEDGIQRILDKLDLKAADLRDEVRREELRNERYPAIARAVNSWVLEATDLLEALRLLQPMMERQTVQANKMLVTAVADYNEAWESIHTGRSGFESDVESYWPEGPLQRRDLANLIDNEIVRTHQQQILPINDALAVIQSAVRSGGDRGKLRPGLADLDRLLTPAIAAVQAASRRATQALEALRPRAAR